MAFAHSAPLRLANVLELFRPLASEVVVGVDDRNPDAAGDLQAIADRIVFFPYREPGDSVLPWLHAQCSAAWILSVDEDEVPSPGLLEGLPGLLRGRVTHWWLPRRWLYGGPDTYLDQPPWIPDYQLRLYRNDPTTLRFSDEFHRPVVVSGQAGFAREPLWHLDCIVNSFESRRAKVLRYERHRRGMRVAGLAHNSAFYLPELLADPRVAPVAELDAQLIRGVMAGGTTSQKPPIATVTHSGREEIDRLWPGAPYDNTTWSARLTRVGQLEWLYACATHTVTVAVENLGRVTWPWGSNASPLIQVGARFLDNDGREVEPSLHTPLPADLPPSSSLDLPVHVRAPSRSGRYRLSVDLVHEHVRWFDCAVEWPIEVVGRHRVAVGGRGEQLEAALDRLQLEPAIEPVILQQGAVTGDGPFGHDCIPGLGGYLLDGIDGHLGAANIGRLASRTVKLVRRARRMKRTKATAPLPREGEACLLGLATCERLHLAARDWDAHAAPTRQLWRLAATARAARALGLFVSIETDVLIKPDGAIDKVLMRMLSHSANKQEQ